MRPRGYCLCGLEIDTVVVGETSVRKAAGDLRTSNVSDRNHMQTWRGGGVKVTREGKVASWNRLIVGGATGEERESVRVEVGSVVLRAGEIFFFFLFFLIITLSLSLSLSLAPLEGVANNTNHKQLI